MVIDELDVSSFAQKPHFEINQLMKVVRTLCEYFAKVLRMAFVAALERYSSRRAGSRGRGDACRCRLIRLADVAEVDSGGTRRASRAPVARRGQGRRRRGGSWEERRARLILNH